MTVKSRIVALSDSRPIPLLTRSMTHSAAYSPIDRARGLSKWMHAWFIWLLIGVDLLAAFWSAPGKELRGTLGELPGLALPVNIPSLLLAAMLFIAGLGLRRAHLALVARRPLLLAIGTLGCWGVPLLLLAILWWPAAWLLPDPDRDQVWLGLVIVAAMPAAQSSVAWTQHARGNVLLALALVLLTTFASPVVTPELIRAIGQNTLAAGADFDEILSARFLFVWVILPSLLGWLTARLIGGARVEQARPWLSVLSCAMLLMLNYINASYALPKLIASADWRILGAALFLSFALCVGCFGAALGFSRALKLRREESSALVYALGMKNNGVALTLTGGLVLERYPLVSLVLICYILLQHCTAGVLGRRWLREE